MFTQEQLDRFKFSDAALEAIEEMDADFEADAAQIADGRLTREALLVHCLNGAEPDREQGWRDYVDAIVAASQSRAATARLLRLDEERDATEERACAVLDDREGL